MTVLPDTLPWHEDLWSDWRRQLQDGRLPHAILLTGSTGLGKRQLAQGLAYTLFCRAEIGSRPCGHCKACELLAAETHPDLRVVEPEAPGKAVRVDQIRELVGFLAATAQQGGWKCVIITPADAMNVQAANALLKSLEEPPGNSLIFLVSSNPGRMLPTIRSRCRLLTVKAPPRAQALAWLESRGVANAEELLDYTHDAPCAALAAAESKALEQRGQFEDALLSLAAGSVGTEEAVKRLLESSPAQALDDLLAILGRVARAQGLTEWAGVRPEWSAMLDGRDPRLVFRFRDRVIQTKHELLSGTNPNPQLLWEDLLISWRLLMGAGSSR